MKFAKRIMALVLVCLLVFSIAPPVRVQAATTGFSDVSSSHSNYKAITFLKNNGIMVGLSTSTFGPSKNIEREDFVTILYRVAGEPSVSGTCSFSDVEKGSYYEKAVLWAQQKGITSGVGNGKFGVNANLKYEDCLTFLYRFAKHIGVSTTLGAFPSSYKNYDSYAKDPTAWASGKKLLEKVSVRVTNGDNLCTRADTAQLIYNFYKAFRKTYGLVITDFHFDARYNDSQYHCFGYAQQGFSNGSGPAVVKMLQEACGTPSANIKKYGFDEYDDVDTEAELRAAFKSAFKNAKCIDVCYAYIFVHGDPSKSGSMNLVTDSTYGEQSASIPGATLYEIANSYQGKMIILMEGCSHGSIVKYFKEQADAKRTKNTLKLNHPDIYATAAAGTSSTFHPFTSANWKNKVAYGGGTYCMTKALETYTSTGTPKADNKVSISISFKQFSNSTSVTTFTMPCRGNKDGFVSFAELDLAIKGTVEKFTPKTTGFDGTTQYFSTQPDYCAFGKLS